MNSLLAAMFLDAQRGAGPRQARERRVDRPASVRRRDSRSARREQ